MMKREKNTKYALVLSGGGFKGAFQLGALNYLNDNWQEITGDKGRMKFDLIAGVSVGAINGAMLAINKLGQLNDLWLNKIAKNGVSEIYTSDFIDTDHKGDDLKMKIDLSAIGNQFLSSGLGSIGLWDKLKLLFSKKKRSEVLKRLFHSLSTELKSGINQFKAIADNAPLRNKLLRMVDRKRIINSKFLCGFVSLDNGAYHSVLHSEFQNNADFVNAILASACIPTIWQPIDQITFKKDQKKRTALNLIDGGVKNVSPLGDVVKHINNDSGYDYKIIIINCHSGQTSHEDYRHKNIAQIAMRSVYEIAFTEIFNNDVKHFLKINDLVRQAKHWSQDAILFDEGTLPHKAFDAVVIQPDPSIELGNSLVANERLVNLRVTHGELMAQRALKGGAL